MKPSKSLDIVMLIAILIMAFFTLVRIDTKPRVFIIREYEADSIQGHCRIVDYTIGGYATSAVFYNYEDGVYEDFMRMLEKEGRITR